MAKRNAIGLDIGTSGVRAAEMSFSSAGMTLAQFGQVALPEGAVRDGQVINQPVVADAIRTLWSQTSFSTKKVIMGVANQRVLVRQLDMPKMPAGELKKALPYQVQEFLPMSVQDAVLDFHPIETVNRDGSEQIRGLLVAVSRDVVLGHVETAESAGLQPTMVDLSSFAVLRTLGEASDADQTVEALIEIGSAVTNLVVHQGGVPRFVRILMMGGQHITDHVCERMGIPYAEAEQTKQRLGLTPGEGHDKVASRVLEGAIGGFIDEVRGSIDYFNASNPTGRVQRIVLSGGGSSMRGLAQRLATELQTTTVAADALSRFGVGDTGLSDEQLAAVSTVGAVPIGLAIGAV
ncbi:MAG: pilus assembly protein PilM [Micrococcales bacterium]|nr:MAG: pilus assembly protein PilM [Micrococcales bacterium]PIE26813.1 MAG: pilus assembly protein PilM [Micrococcales bacterium]